MSRNRNRYNMTIILPCQLNISFSERTITIMHPRLPPSGKMHYGRFLKSGTQIIQPSLLNIEFGKKEKIHQIPTNRKKFLFIVKQSIEYILICLPFSFLIWKSRAFMNLPNLSDKVGNIYLSRAKPRFFKL